MMHETQYPFGPATCEDVANAVRRLGLYFIYRGQEARELDEPMVELPFRQEELMRLGTLLLRHVSCGHPEDRS